MERLGVDTRSLEGLSRIYRQLETGVGKWEKIHQHGSWNNEEEEYYHAAQLRYDEKLKVGTRCDSSITGSFQSVDSRFRIRAAVQQISLKVQHPVWKFKDI